ncbi:MAG: 16S rRNA (guanine(527)-N(7))-methyltransferase RsmG [Mariniblastus sp.]|nr:16S rRNA (guanine(527)-N(7))-methyltransferase RsmG [Mariniblastus sp.]
MEDLKAAIAQFHLTDAIELSDDARLKKVRQYCILLWIKNEQMNLTRHTTWEQFVSRDLVDTLQLASLLPTDSQVLDVGSGGGVPGMLLAILRPDLKITLTESVGKKAAALGEFAGALELDVEIYNERAENILDDFRFDFTVARAVGPMIKMCRWFEEHWPSVGRLLAIKGPKWSEELAEAEQANLTSRLQVSKVKEYLTPGTDWNSVILEVQAKKEVS